MAGGAIGTAYLQIIPKFKDIGKGLKAEMAGAGKVAGSKFSAAFSGAMSKAGDAIKTVAVAGSVAAAAGVVALGKASLSAYADYEQLTGGIETLYGDAYDTVMKNASTAFKRVGMSQNQYMETATAYAATLRQAVGGDVQKAAAQSDKALLAMADNANKMGTDMTSVTDAFNGFAKQNYTMLDNLNNMGALAA